MTTPKANRAAQTLEPTVFPLWQYLKDGPTLTPLPKVAVEVVAHRPQGQEAVEEVAEAVGAEEVVAVVPPLLQLLVKPCRGTVLVAF